MDIDAEGVAKGAKFDHVRQELLIVCALANEFNRSKATCPLRPQRLTRILSSQSVREVQFNGNTLRTTANALPNHARALHVCTKSNRISIAEREGNDWKETAQTIPSNALMLRLKPVEGTPNVIDFIFVT